MNDINDNQNPEIETTDVEAHAAKIHVDGPDTDDVEGHGAFSKHLDGPDTDDVEGHTGRWGVAEDENGDDTEGHGAHAKV